MLKKKWIKQGFIDEPVAEDIDLKTEIRKMCEEKHAIILAHYYTITLASVSAALRAKASESPTKSAIS